MDLQPAEAFGLFAVPIYKTKLTSASLQDIIDAVDNTGGWHEGTEKNFISKDKFLLNHPSLKNFKDEIKSHLNNMMLNHWKTNIQMTITQSWANKTPKGTSHVEHTHRNSIWNGVVFLKDHPTPMKFRDPNPWKDLWDVQDEVSESNWANGNIANIEPKEGMLIMFPHYLHHSVPVNKYDDTRYSLAFNTWFGQSFGSIGRLTYIGADNGTQTTSTS